MKFQNIEELQNAIEQSSKTRDAGEKSAERMLQIGESYLRGDVLKDPVAAQAWLERVLEQGEIPQAVTAMELIGREVLHQKMILSELDYIAVCKELEERRHGQGEETKNMTYLLALKALGDAERSG